MKPLCLLQTDCRRSDSAAVGLDPTRCGQSYFSEVVIETVDNGHPATVINGTVLRWRLEHCARARHGPCYLAKSVDRSGDRAAARFEFADRAASRFQG
jgi:hypothetical protein